MALLEREQSGEGQWVQTSLLAGADLHARLPGRALADRRRGRRAGRQRPPDRHPDRRVPDRATATSTSPPPATRCGERFCEAARRAAAAADDPDYATGPARSKNRKALNDDDRRSHRQAHRAPNGSNCFNEAGVPCGPIYTIDQIFADPQVEHLGMARRSGRTRRMKVAAGDQHDARQPAVAVAHAPISASTPTTLRELGYNDAAIADLRAGSRVILPAPGEIAAMRGGASSPERSRRVAGHPLPHARWRNDRCSTSRSTRCSPRRTAASAV